MRSLVLLIELTLDSVKSSFESILGGMLKLFDQQRWVGMLAERGGIRGAMQVAKLLHAQAAGLRQSPSEALSSRGNSRHRARPPGTGQRPDRTLSEAVYLGVPHVQHATKGSECVSCSLPGVLDR